MEIKKGIIIIVDALGASNLNMNEIAHYLAHRAQISKVISSIFEATKQKKTSEYCREINDVEVFTFGDTMLVALELPENKEAIKLALNLLFSGLEAFQALSFVDNKALYRGAFSYGNYITDVDANTVMGDAVTDAANWYEQPDMPIVMATPKTQYFLNALDGKENGLNLHSLCDYNVPLKHGKYRNCYIANWMYPFLEETLRRQILKIDCKNSEVRDHLFKILAEMTVPIGTEVKYDNLNVYVLNKTELYHTDHYLLFEQSED